MANRRRPRRPVALGVAPPGAANPDVPAPARPSRRAQMAPTLDRRLGRLMLPLRLFLGVTFVYAGLVKLLDPAFLDPTAPGSLVAQLHAFQRASPLAPLIAAVGIPLATPIGLLIALGELAAGMGALTGLAPRLAAWSGFAISILFFLTASWATTPYFYGPDLPYAAGWLTLALVGDGGLHVLRGRLARPKKHEAAWSPERRIFIEAAVLGVAAFAIGLLAFDWTRLEGALGIDPTTAAGGTAAPPIGGAGAGTAGATGAGAGASTAAAASPPSGSLAIATVSEVASAGSATFTDPRSGDPGVLVKLPNGSIVAFDAICTHAGCTVQYVPQDQALECPCHGAVFDPAHQGAVLAGPAPQPLQSLPIQIDQQSGQITLAG